MTPQSRTITNTELILTDRRDKTHMWAPHILVLTLSQEKKIIPSRNMTGRNKHNLVQQLDRSGFSTEI